MGSGNQSTQAKPFGPAKPLLNSAMKDARGLYNQGVGKKVTPFDAATKQGMNAALSNANANLNGQGLSGQLQSIVDQGGYNNDQMTAVKNWQSQANAAFDPNSDPAFQSILSKMQNDARNQVGMSASAAGRYGSGIAQGAVARNVGDVTNNMLSAEYNRWRNSRDAANNSLFNAGQGAMGNLTSAYSGLNAPIADLMKVGTMKEQMAQRKASAPWDYINNAIGTANLTSGYGKKTANDGSNPFLNAIGGAATGYGLLGSMGLF